MEKKDATRSSRDAAKKTWQTPNVESFAVAGITENAGPGNVNDGAVSNAVS